MEKNNRNNLRHPKEDGDDIDHKDNLGKVSEEEKTNKC